MLVRVEIVTPRNRDLFLKRIENNDPMIDHLCIEMIHWGFDEVMAWIYKVHNMCDRSIPKIMYPAISVHGFGFDGEVTLDMKQMIIQSGALWMPRVDRKNQGKDCATIINEMLSKRILPEKKQHTIIKRYPDDFANDIDLETYRDLSTMIRPEIVDTLPHEEFEQLLRDTMNELEE